jgi:hypothetical protein
MSSARRGDKRPSRENYHKNGRRAINKRRRIERCNGSAFLKQWEHAGYGLRT